MNIKKTFNQIRVIFFGGISALVLLNLILFFYMYYPLARPNEYNTTDYTFEPNRIYFWMYEGIAYGKTDSAGFNNNQFISKPDIIILGSSHMQAKEVMPKYNVANQLQSNLVNSGYNFSVYNMGISSHGFIKCLKYLKNTTAHSEKYIVIETSDIDFSGEEIESLLQYSLSRIQINTYNNKIINFVRRLPLYQILRTQQTQGLIKVFLGKNTSTNQSLSTTQENITRISANYEKLFSYIEENSDGRQIIVFYHPTGMPTANGKLEYITSESYLEEFKLASKRHGIIFLDLTEETEKLWQTEHKTTHGFTTGTAFSGHLNKNGHRIAARKLADCIIQNEENSDVAF